MTIKKEDLQAPQGPTWCPGCGDHAIWMSVKDALTKLKVKHEDVVIVYGIGCHGHMCNVIRGYGFEGLHGRPIPVAEGVKLANNALTVIVVAGDGDTYGEGLNHFIAGVRGNHDVTLLVHDNRVYGLTTGQASPTSPKGYKSKSTPTGMIEVPVNPLAVAIAEQGTFVSQGFSGDPLHLSSLIQEAVAHQGFSVVNILQNCATFNKVNDVRWFKEHTYKVDSLKPKHKVGDPLAAMKLALNLEQLPLGVVYQSSREAYDQAVPAAHEKPLVKQSLKGIDLTASYKQFM